MIVTMPTRIIGTTVSLACLLAGAMLLGGITTSKTAELQVLGGAALTALGLIGFWIDLTERIKDRKLFKDRG